MKLGCEGERVSVLLDHRLRSLSCPGDAHNLMAQEAVRLLAETSRVENKGKTTFEAKLEKASQKITFTEASRVNVSVRDPSRQSSLRGHTEAGWEWRGCR